MMIYFVIAFNFFLGVGGFLFANESCQLLIEWIVPSGCEVGMCKTIAPSSSSSFSSSVVSGTISGESDMSQVRLYTQHN